MLKRVIASSLLLASYMGALWQSWDIVAAYLKYETVSRVTVERPESFYSPSLVACKENPDDGAANTIGDIFGKYFKESSDICRIKVRKFPNDWDLVQTKDQDVIREHLSLTRLIRATELCYHIRLRRRQPINGHQLFGGDTARLLAVQFSQGFINSSEFLYYYIFPNNSNFYHPFYTYSSVNFSSEKRAVTTYTYSHTISISMPFPYDTDCWNYTSLLHGIGDSYHCYEDCLQKEYSRRGYFTPMFKLYDDHTRDRDKVRDEEMAGIRWGEETDGKCLQACHHVDCERHDYSLRFIHQYADDHAEIDLNGPHEPSIVSVSSPKISQIDVVTQALSCISFWFAFSPMAMFGIDMYSHLLSRHRNHSNSRRGRARNRIKHTTDRLMDRQWPVNVDGRSDSLARLQVRNN